MAKFVVTFRRRVTQSFEFEFEATDQMEARETATKMGQRVNEIQDCYTWTEDWTDPVKVLIVKEVE